MLTMSKVPEDTHLGKLGEAYVQWLLRDCAIKRVSDQGDDIGIDLYCEGLSAPARSSRLPLSHFWIQVKTTQLKAANRMDAALKISVDLKHVRYWLRQPVPVYLFRVAWPKEGSAVTLKNLVVYDITKWANTKGDSLIRARSNMQRKKKSATGKRKPQNTFTLSPVSGYAYRLAGARRPGRHTIESFVREHVPYSHSLLAGRLGIWRASPNVESEIGSAYRAGITAVSPDRFRERFLARMFGTTYSMHTLMSMGAWKRDEDLDNFCREVGAQAKKLAGKSRAQLWAAVRRLDLIEH